MNLKEKILLIVLLLLGAGFGAYHLTESPPTWIDEGMAIQLAINLSEHGVMGLRTAPDNFVSGAYISMGFPLIFPLAAVFKIAGVGLLQARIFMLGWILLLVALSYVYILRAYGGRAAFLTGLLLTTFAPLYGNGKNVLGEIPGLVFFILFLLFLQRMEKEGFLSKPFLSTPQKTTGLPVEEWGFLERDSAPRASPAGLDRNRGDHGLARGASFFITGLALGLFAATKPIFLLALGAFALVIVGSRIFRGKSDFLKFPLRGSLIFGAGVILPLLVWIFTQFFLSDSFYDLFAFYRNPYQLENVFSVMAANFARFFKELSPLYTVLLFGLWGVSLLLREREKRGSAGLAEKTAFIFSLLVLFFYLRTPGWYRYFFPAQIMALIFFPSALFYLGDRVSRTCRGSPTANLAQSGKSDFLKFIGTVILSGLAVFQAYQVGFDSWVAGSYQSTRTRELGAYFREWNPDTSLFIYNSPEVVTFLSRHSVYYQFLGDNKRVIFGQAELERVSRERFSDAIVLAVDESGEYNLNLFPGYQLKDRIDRYIILERERK